MTSMSSSIKPVSSAPRPFITSALVEILGRGVDGAIILIGALMVTVVFINVVLHTFDHDMSWVDEVGELLMVWVSFLGGAAAARRGSHMAIGEFVDKLSPAHRRWADTAIQALSLIVLGMLDYYSGVLVQENWGNRLTVTGLPMAWQYMGMLVGCVAMTFFVAVDFWLILRGVPREQRYSGLD